MMHLYKIQGNTIEIISCPPEDVPKGEYLLIQDQVAKRSLIVQVIDIGYANIPGILEDLLREATATEIEGRNIDPLKVESYVKMIKDAKLFTCKIRAAESNGELISDVSWIPSRSTSKIMRLSHETLVNLAEIGRKYPLPIGTTKTSSPFSIEIRAIDGKLNIITGKKETGKSHLSKLLVLGLIEYGAISLILDINGEYTNLGFNPDQTKNRYHNQIKVLTPGQNFKVTLAYAGFKVLSDIMRSVLDLPGTSAWELRRIWEYMAQQQAISLAQLNSGIRQVENEHIRDALIRRFESLVNSGFFTDNASESTTLEKVFTDIRDGGAFVINLRDSPSMVRQIVVEFILSKLTYLLESWIIRAVFLFAEEAHLYLRETYWDDIVTRMRHLGVFTTFITNQPDSIREGIYRQADNIFLFNFTNEHDLLTVSKAAKVDAETVTSIARGLPPHHCLVLGKVVNELPFVVKVKSLGVKAMGQTRFFFARD